MFVLRNEIKVLGCSFSGVKSEYKGKLLASSHAFCSGVPHT